MSAAAHKIDNRPKALQIPNTGDSDEASLRMHFVAFGPVESIGKDPATGKTIVAFATRAAAEAAAADRTFGVPTFTSSAALSASAAATANAGADDQDAVGGSGSADGQGGLAEEPSGAYGAGDNEEEEAPPRRTGSQDDDGPMESGADPIST